MRLIVKEPFLKKICYSEKCQQQYFIIFVRNRLLISKRCEEKYNIEELYLNLETLARFHYQESCIGSFVQILIQSYDSNEFKGKDVNFCYNVRLRRCQNKIILERKKRNSEEYSNIFTLTRHEDLKHLLNELQDRFLYPLFPSPEEQIYIGNFVTRYCQQNNNDMINFKNSNVTDILNTLDENLSPLEKHRLYYKIYYNVHILNFFNHLRHFKIERKKKVKYTTNQEMIPEPNVPHDAVM